MSIRNLDFFYGESQALKNVNFDIAEREVTAFIGPSGCGKSTLLRTLNRMYSLYPRQRATGEILLRRPQHPRRGDGPQPAAREGRHGVPEADAVPDVDLRQHRVRRAPVRTAVRARDGRARRMGADEGRDVERSEGQAATDRHGAVRRASSSACASRAPWRCEPEVLLLDEPTSALDPISTAKIEELIARAQGGLHDRDRHAQHATGGARARTTRRTCTSAS